MILNKGDIVWRYKSLAPMYKVIRVTNSDYKLKAVTVVNITLIVEKEKAGFRYNQKEYITFPKKLNIKKEFMDQPHIENSWKILSAKEILAHPLYDEEMLKTINTGKKDKVENINIRKYKTKKGEIISPLVKSASRKRLKISQPHHRKSLELIQDL